MKKIAITSFVLAAATLGQVASAVVFEQDFESPAFSLGNLPGQEGWTQNRLDLVTPTEDGSGLRQVVSTTNVPVTGAGGSQFARLMTPDFSASADVGASVLFTNPLNPMVSDFTFTGKIGYSPEMLHAGSGSAFGLLQLNSSGSSAFNGIFFGFRGRLNDVAFVVRNGNDYENVFTAASADTFYGYEVTVNLSNGNSWGITVYDHLGNNVGSASNLAIRGGLTSFDAIRASIVTARNDDTAVYFDNLAVIPEAGTMAWLMGLGTMMVLVLVRRKRN